MSPDSHGDTEDCLSLCRFHDKQACHFEAEKQWRAVIEHRAEIIRLVEQAGSQDAGSDELDDCWREAFESIADAYRELGEIDSALHWYNQADCIWRNHSDDQCCPPRILIKQGDLLVQCGNDSGAIIAYSEALPSDHCYEERHHDLASCYSDDLSPTEAALVFAKRGHAQWRLGDFDAAADDYLRAIDLDLSLKEQLPGCPAHPPDKEPPFREMLRNPAQYEQALKTHPDLQGGREHTLAYLQDAIAAWTRMGNRNQMEALERVWNALGPDDELRTTLRIKRMLKNPNKHWKSLHSAEVVSFSGFSRLVKWAKEEYALVIRQYFGRRSAEAYMGKIHQLQQEAARHG